jgi:crotonobetainyl-CoA:carnitine CoA-transferase CaiB-like acyl-CoA transferase
LPATTTSRVRGLASHFVWVNRSKESLTLDLKQPAARAVLMDLLAGADVLVQNLAPGAAARLGLAFEALQPAHPRLIVCDISGYGNDGPYRDRKAYDLLIQSEAGFLSVTGTPEAAAKAGAPVADIAAGMYAYSSVLAALLQRGRTGQGGHIDVSMLEALTEWMGYPLYYAFEGRRTTAAQRRGARHHRALWPVCHGRRHRHARRAERTRMAGLLCPGAAAAFAGHRPALCQRRATQRAPRCAAGGHCGRVAGLSLAEVLQRLDAGADCQRPRQRHGRPVGPPAARGAQALAQVATRRRLASPRCCRPARRQL